MLFILSYTYTILPGDKCMTNLSFKIFRNEEITLGMKTDESDSSLNVASGICCCIGGDGGDQK